jgi:hypothetical protein
VGGRKESIEAVARRLEAFGNGMRGNFDDGASAARARDGMDVSVEREDGLSIREVEACEALLSHGFDEPYEGGRGVLRRDGNVRFRGFGGRESVHG